MATSTITVGEAQEIHVGTFKSKRAGVADGEHSAAARGGKNEIDVALLLLSLAPPNIIALPCVGVERTWDAQTLKGVYTYSYEGVTRDPPESQTTF